MSSCVDEDECEGNQGRIAYLQLLIDAAAAGQATLQRRNEELEARNEALRTALKKVETTTEISSERYYYGSDDEMVYTLQDIARAALELDLEKGNG